MMTPRQRAVTALTLGTPDQVPTFELEFQLSREMFGLDLQSPEYSLKHLRSLSPAERDRLIHKSAEDYAHVYTELDYAIIPAYGPGYGGDGESFIVPEYRTWIKALTGLVGKERMLGAHGDGTYAIPDGDGILEFSYQLADEPEKLFEKAERMCAHAIERNRMQREAGIEVLLLCSDYCFNNGPFISPQLFSELIFPYLSRIIEDARAHDLYAIKHTDGDIMPIIDQLVAANPHALHSIDPMAGVDIRKVKELYGDKVALCGNVHCAALQTGTDDEVRESAEYCLTYGKQGGGYLFCTSNIPFKGMPPYRYQMILDIWKRMREY